MTTMFLVANVGVQAQQPKQPAEPDGLDALVEAAETWAKDNIDDSVLATFGQVDRDRIRGLFAELEKRLHGDSVYDLDALRDNARALLPLLLQSISSLQNLRKNRRVVIQDETTEVKEIEFVSVGIHGWRSSRGIGGIGVYSNTGERGGGDVFFTTTPSVLVVGLALSVSSHLLFAITIYSIARFCGGDHPTLFDHFIIAPISLVANCVPLPGGLGGMETVLDFLYRASSARTPKIK